MLGMSREEYILKYGPDAARTAILEMRAIQARQEEGDPFGEGLDSESDAKRGGSSQESGDTRRGEVTDQPPPRPGVNETAEIGLANFTRAYRKQIEKGRERYKTGLQTFNGRNAYVDLLQEAADGVNYATQLYLEAKTFASAADRAVFLMKRVRYVLNDVQYISISEEQELDKMILQFIQEVESCLQKSGLSRYATQNHV